ncbi:MAG: N-acetyltransferase [Thermoanaerobaculia bacterium]|nr:MAG: N-acetyltransferase [Thermoanaerobaculia bacterium]
MAPSPAAIEVRPVRTRRDRRRFVRLPWRIYRDTPAWVPPLEIERMDFIDRRKNAFFRHSDAELYLAEREGEPVGRIAAIENRRHLETYRDGTGFFGFFESIDDPSVARALVAKASDWARARGLARLRGPMSFTINDECGLLLDAFELPPVLLMSYNPPYYRPLLEDLGFRKAQDLWAYRLDAPERVPERLGRLARAVAARGISVRKLDFSRFDEEVALVHRIHSQAWASNWGAVPLTVEEMRALARELKPLADRDLVFLAEDGGEPVGVSVTVPDINQALPAARGRLLPFGLVRLLLARRRIDAVRVLILGVLPGHRFRGVDAALYARTMEEAIRKGYRWGELSWVLESNPAMNSAAEFLGATRYKTYRIYDLEL